MSTTDSLERGRQLFGRQNWHAAYEVLSRADERKSLAAEDLERLAVAAFMMGRDDRGAEFWTRAHQELLAAGEINAAVRCAFWMGFTQGFNGDVATGSGWLSRCARILDEAGQDCVERGYLWVATAVQTMHEGDLTRAFELFAGAGELAQRFGDRQLQVMSQLGRGQVMTLQGQTDAGLALLDEVMVAVLAGDVSPIMAGMAYCASIEACRQSFDLRRAQEWTAALASWCASQPGMVAYRRQCLVHRSEIMRLHGAWPDALDEARRAGELLVAPSSRPPAAGAAFYEQAELLRLQGEFAKAEDAYRLASRWGRSPQPGLALLRLAQGQVEAAANAVRLVLDEPSEPADKATVLAAAVEILIAAGEVEGAGDACVELSALFRRVEAPLLGALTMQSSGSLALATGSAREALAALRQAWKTWQQLDAPYDAARARVLIGLACRALGDEDTAQMELDASRWVFAHLGAVPDVARVDRLLARSGTSSPHGLTDREIQVLRMVALGKTNREIADELFLSLHTIRRHLQNIFAKLDVGSRAAATAFAVQNHLT